MKRFLACSLILLLLIGCSEQKNKHTENKNEIVSKNDIPGILVDNLHSVADEDDFQLSLFMEKQNISSVDDLNFHAVLKYQGEESIMINFQPGLVELAVTDLNGNFIHPIGRTANLLVEQIGHDFSIKIDYLFPNYIKKLEKGNYYAYAIAEFSILDDDEDIGVLGKNILYMEVIIPFEVK